MHKLFLVVNVDWFFLSHRLPIAIEAKKQGWDVTIVANDTGKAQLIRDSGLNFINMPMVRTGLNPKHEWETFYFLYSLFRKEKPSLVHLVGLKTILWGGLAARLTQTYGIISAVCGLGVLFDEQHENSLVSRSILKVFKFIHDRKNVVAIFQNSDDKTLFLKNRIVSAYECAFTKGSGVDLAKYHYREEQNDGLLKVIFTARMVEDKGTLVLIQAAEMLRKEYGDKVQFLLCGSLDANPNAIQKEQLEALCDGKYICWLGHRSDIRSLLHQSHIMAFPSWYREGLPKSVIEAEAIGLPVITTDSTGCRDTVIDGYNGYVIPTKNSAVLADRLKRLFDDEELRKRMGYNARAFAEKNFSINDVVNVHMRIYNQLLDKC